MKTTGVSSIPKFGLLDFLGHPIVYYHIALPGPIRPLRIGELCLMQAFSPGQGKQLRIITTADPPFTHTKALPTTPLLSRIPF